MGGNLKASHSSRLKKKNIQGEKKYNPKVPLQPWPYDEIDLINATCCKAEHKWRTTKYSTHFDKLKDLMKKKLTLQLKLPVLNIFQTQS